MTALSFIKKINNYLIELIFPCRCVLCQKEPAWLCQFCLAKLGAEPKFISARELYRQRQVAKRFFSIIAGVWYFWDYRQPAVRRIIHSYKFGQIKGLSLVFQKMFDNFFKDMAQPEIVALPPDKKRLKIRGFDHILEMIPAKLVSQKISLARIKHTPAQSLASGFRERWQNVKGVFRVGFQGSPSAEPAPSKTEGLRMTRGPVVFLVDDILTTGATALSAAEALRPYAQKIYLVVLAKA